MEKKEKEKKLKEINTKETNKNDIMNDIYNIDNNNTKDYNDILMS